MAPEQRQAAARDFPTIINAAGTLTRLSAGPLAPGVMQAMLDADAVSVDMFELQAHASRLIAGGTGAEAGLVCSGAAAGLLLGAAACMAGLDVGRMNALPDTDGPNEIIVARGQRNGYDHALRAAGARLVEVGLAEPLAGAGTRNAEPWEYAAATGPKTAAILYVESPLATPTLAEVVAVARAAGVPVIVDAAAELPPAANLRRFIDAGADLVVFSGGKALGGPAGTGILCGRGDLVMSAALQFLDMDIRWADWRPPADFIDRSRLQGLPRHGVGRACKVGKHEIMGLLAALKHFREEGDAARHARWLEICERIGSGIAATNRFTVALRGGAQTDRVPVLELRCADAVTAQDLRSRLLANDPQVHLGFAPFRPERLIVNPTCLRDAEIPPLIAALSG